MTSHPMGSTGLLALARASLDRLTPHEALVEQSHGALLVDVRTEAQRALTGEVPGALVIDLTVLPWRLDPTYAWRIPEATGWDLRCILLCRHGYSSSVAAWQLRQMGLHRATDVVGGVDGWVRSGLPISSGPADIRP